MVMTSIKLFVVTGALASALSAPKCAVSPRAATTMSATRADIFRGASAAALALTAGVQSAAAETTSSGCVPLARPSAALLAA